VDAKMIQRMILLSLMMLLMHTPVYAEEKLDALEYFQALQKGDFKAASEIGKILEEQRIDEEKWAKRGDPEAQYKLGISMQVKGDFIQAYKWFLLAQVFGKKDGRFARDMTEKKMTPEQISKAQSLAKEWLDKRAKSALDYTAGLQAGKDSFENGDYSAAIEKLKPLAEQGHAFSQGVLGIMYGNGWGVSENKEKAFRWFRLAAEQKISSAQSVLGKFYKDGIGVEQSYEKAANWYGLAAKQGNAESQYALALMNDEGTGVPQNSEEAVKLYRLAAEQGHAFAQSNLGYSYQYGIGVKKNSIEATKWYRKSAEQGHAIAQANLGKMYYEGLGITKDFIRSYMWLTISALNGNVNGEKNRAIVEKYMTTGMVTESLSRAMDRYKPLAKEGNAKAQYYLGILYSDDNGVTTDYKKSMNWLKWSAAQGNNRAQSKIGEAYYYGKGVAKDFVQAYKWLIIAYRNFDDESRELRELIEKQITDKQIIEAKQLAREWMKKHPKN
jgi:uncharacterized protein